MRKHVLSALPLFICTLYLFYPVLWLILLPFGLHLLPPNLSVTLSAITAAGCILCLLCADLTLPSTRAVRIGRILSYPACLLNSICFFNLWVRDSMELPLVAIAMACGGICALIPLFAGPLHGGGIPLKIILSLITVLFCVCLSVSTYAQLENAKRVWTIEEYPSPGGTQTVIVQSQNLGLNSSDKFTNIHVYERPKDLNVGIGFLRAPNKTVYNSNEKFPHPTSVWIQWNNTTTYTIIENYNSET